MESNTKFILEIQFMILLQMEKVEFISLICLSTRIIWEHFYKVSMLNLCHILVNPKSQYHWIVIFLQRKIWLIGVLLVLRFIRLHKKWENKKEILIRYLSKLMDIVQATFTYKSLLITNLLLIYSLIWHKSLKWDQLKLKT